jgi:branched-chain amino acid aminotransferase
MNAGEALMLNNAGQVAECTGDNLFLVKHGKILTPHPTCGILLGITRETVIHLARADGIEVEESFLTIYDVTSADECFLTGTAAEVIPCVGLDNRKIGCGTPGQVTQRIMSLFRAHTATGVPFDA